MFAQKKKKKEASTRGIYIWFSFTEGGVVYKREIVVERAKPATNAKEADFSFCCPGKRLVQHTSHRQSRAMIGGKLFPFSNCVFGLQLSGKIFD